MTDMVVSRSAISRVHTNCGRPASWPAANRSKSGSTFMIDIPPHRYATILRLLVWLLDQLSPLLVIALDGNLGLQGVEELLLHIAGK